MLSVLAATANDRAINYCWVSWLMIYTDFLAMPVEIKTFDRLAVTVIMHSIQNRFVRTLNQSFEIFFPRSKFSLFTKFLSETSRRNFQPETSDLLGEYLLEIGRGNVQLFDLELTSDELMALSIEALIEYVKLSFDSMEHSQLLLDCICASEINDIVAIPFDFSTLAQINRIIQFTKIRVRIDELMKTDPMSVMTETTEDSMAGGSLVSVYAHNEFIRIRDDLIVSKAFEQAMQLADLLNLSKDVIVFEQWVHSFEADPNSVDLNACERQIECHGLSPVVLINFLAFIADRIEFNDRRKYKVLKKTIDVIRKYHLNGIDGVNQDSIEFNLIKCQLAIDDPIEDSEILNSEYFVSVMAKERGILFKTFPELKEMSGVYELNVSSKDELRGGEVKRFDSLMDHLLDQGDIVQALRLQAMFNHRTLDLHYIVFCMALAEGLASLVDLSVEDKQMLNEGIKVVASKFNRRTLRLKRSSSSSSSPTTKSFFDSMDANLRIDFEELPSGEKQDLLDAIQVSLRSILV